MEEHVDFDQIKPQLHEIAIKRLESAFEDLPLKWEKTEKLTWAPKGEELIFAVPQSPVKLKFMIIFRSDSHVVLFLEGLTRKANPETRDGYASVEEFERRRLKPGETPIEGRFQGMPPIEVLNAFLDWYIPALREHFIDFLTGKDWKDYRVDWTR